MNKKRNNKIILSKIEQITNDDYRFHFNVRSHKYNDFYFYIIPVIGDGYCGSYYNTNNIFHDSKTHFVVVKTNDKVRNLLETSCILVIHCLGKNFKKEYLLNKVQIGDEKFWSILEKK